jgi:hypothetical protein
MKTEGNGYRLRELTSLGIRSKVLTSDSDVYGLPFTFTIVDSASKPVPNGILLLKYADRTDSVPGDLCGNALVILDSATLAANPLICAAGRNHWPDFSLTIDGFTSDKRLHIAVVRPDSLRRVETDYGLVYYPSNCESLARPMLDYLPKAYAFIHRLTGFAPVDWGTVLSDKPAPVVASPADVQVAGRTYQLFPFSLVSDSGSGRSLVNLHEWTETTIRTNFNYCEPMPRWIYDGLATYAEYRMLTELDSASPFRPNCVAFARHQFGHMREWLIDQQNKGRKTIDVGLLKWQMGGPNQPVVQSEVYKYQLAFWFWWKLSRRYGEAAIADFLVRAKQSRAASSQDFLKTLSAVTGNPDIGDWLKKADVSETVGMLDAYLAGLGR